MEFNSEVGKKYKVTRRLPELLVAETKIFKSEKKTKLRMNKMAKVVTLRLKERELGFIKELSEKENEDKSYAARKLIDYGWIYFILKKYKEGKISIGKASKELNLTITETIELLADLGINSPISYEEYLEGYKYLKGAF
ncbi:MAG: hypothetical protein AABX33_06565 [Nanoarchaeota archaeon]